LTSKITLKKGRSVVVDQVSLSDNYKTKAGFKVSRLKGSPSYYKITENKKESEVLEVKENEIKNWTKKKGEIYVGRQIIDGLSTIKFSSSGSFLTCRFKGDGNERKWKMNGDHLTWHRDKERTRFYPKLVTDCYLYIRDRKDIQTCLLDRITNEKMKEQVAKTLVDMNLI
jgi:hypothetical protein